MRHRSGKEALAVGMSARIIGWEEFGLTARDMNVLLKKHGYLEGEPGAYGVTEKGKPFAEEQYHDNGYGGYAHRYWDTRAWNEDLVPALRADMEANPDGVLAEPPVERPREADIEENDDYDYGYQSSSEHSGPDLSGTGFAIVASVIGGLLVWRYGPPLWRNHIKPAAEKLRTKFKKPESPGP
jgi:hypothetical protein